jgi:hypothetical protein
MFSARSTIARQLRTSVSYTKVSQPSGMPFFAKAKQAAARPEMGVKTKRAEKATQSSARKFFSMEVDPEQLMAMRLYCRAGGCH